MSIIFVTDMVLISQNVTVLWSVKGYLEMIDLVVAGVNLTCKVCIITAGGGGAVQFMPASS